jgi:hypothetical protein
LALEATIFFGGNEGTGFLAGLFFFVGMTRTVLLAIAMSREQSDRGRVFAKSSGRKPGARIEPGSVLISSLAGLYFGGTE